MTPLLFLLVALAGGAGAACRLLLDGIISARVPARFPWATVAINTTGSFLLGLIVGLASHQVVSEGWSVVLGAGFLGGYTTFSTASFETVRLFQERRWGAGILNAVGVLVTTILLAAAGMWIGGNIG
jgi:CrcB protein